MKKRIWMVVIVLLSIVVWIPCDKCEATNGQTLSEQVLSEQVLSEQIQSEQMLAEQQMIEQNARVREAVMQEQFADQAREENEKERRERLRQSGYMQGAYVLLVLSLSGLFVVLYMEHVVRVDVKNGRGTFKCAGFILCKRSGTGGTEICFSRRMLAKSYTGEFRIRLPFFIKVSADHQKARIIYGDRKREIPMKRRMYVRFCEEEIRS